MVCTSVENQKLYQRNTSGFKIISLPPPSALPILCGHQSTLGLNKMSLTRIERFKSSAEIRGSFMSWCLKKQSLLERLRRNAQWSHFGISNGSAESENGTEYLKSGLPQKTWISIAITYFEYSLCARHWEKYFPRILSHLILSTTLRGRS